MQIHAILKNKVLFTTNDGKIITESIGQDAQQILDWYIHNIPVNAR